MKTFLKVILFSGIILAIYTIFPMTLPQQRSEPPPLEEKVGALTMDEFINTGKDIFEGKRGGFGGCILCHDPKLGRAPQLVNMNATSEDRLKDSRYKGKAKSVEEYLRESMMTPSAFVVAGYGVPGTNDSQSPMMNISQYLKPWEVNAAIAYLQTKDGGEATVSPPTGEEGGGGEGAASGSAAVAAAAKTPEEAFKKFGCGACHSHEKTGLVGAIAPNLTHIGTVAGKRKPGMDARAYISESISAPLAFIVPGQPPIMPQDFADKMMVRELEMMVQYLADSK
jgi:cytochrome c553